MKKNCLILVLGLMIIAQNVVNANRLLLESDWNAAEYHKYKEKLEQLHRNKQIMGLLAGDSTNSYNILKYELNLDWYNILKKGKDIKPDDKYWNGTVVITLKSNIDGLSIVPIDAVDLDILSVLADSIPVLPTPKIINNIISVPLNSQLAKDSMVKISIDYKYAKFDNVGFNLYYKGDTSKSVVVEENIAYTVNSPEFARFWFPCNDTPRDKAALTMNVKVPLGYAVASNGLLASIDTISPEAGDDYSIYHWTDTTPIATFLINAVASKFSEYSEWFSPNPLSFQPDSLEVKYYIWAPDLEGNVFSAKRALRRTKQMLEYFSSIFIDYPFCKYGSVEVFPFLYSAMENQTMTNLSKLLFRVTEDGNTTAHEIAHHWFGDLVSSKDWNDIWFKEGGATWSEALWSYERLGKADNAYLSVMLSYSKTYFVYPDLFNIPIWGNSPDIFFNVPLVYLTYNKSAWIFHQLHVLLADNNLIENNKNLAVLKKIFTKYAYKNIDAASFIQMYKDELKDAPLDFDIDKYFSQWLFGAGHPIYDCQALRILTDHTDTLWDVHITLTQTQQGSKIAEVFEMPIWITFFNGNKEVHRVKVINNKEIQEYDFSNVPNFTGCRVDSSRTLCQTPTRSITSIDDNSIDNVIIYPNPAINQRFIYITSISDDNIIGINDIPITITNILGIEQICKVNVLDNSIQIDIINLVDGIYFIRLDNKLLQFIVIN